jgi:hypothetical protein
MEAAILYATVIMQRQDSVRVRNQLFGQPAAMLCQS